MPNNLNNEVVIVKGLDEAKKFFTQWDFRFEKEKRRYLEEIIEKLRSMIIGSMAVTPKDMSRAYYNPGLGRYVYPSKPGSAPAIQTKNLVNNIFTEVRIRKSEAELYVPNSKAEYAAYLEDGTRKMPARPSFIPALDKLPLEEGVVAAVIRTARRY